MMKVWMMFFDGVAVAHYSDVWDANRDAQHLRHTLGASCPEIVIEQKTMGYY